MRQDGRVGKLKPAAEEEYVGLQETEFRNIGALIVIDVPFQMLQVCPPEAVLAGRR